MHTTHRRPLRRRVALGLAGVATVAAAGMATAATSSAATPLASVSVPKIIVSCAGYTAQEQLPLRPCATGARVKEVQRLLNLALPVNTLGQHYGVGWGKLTVDGRFGFYTQLAVYEFQRRYGLTPNAVVSSATWKALNGASALCASFRQKDTLSVRKCDQSLLVAWVQIRLNALVTTLPPINVGGHFGPLTDRAVREYQRSRGLTVDGIVGPITYSYLAAGS